MTLLHDMASLPQASGHRFDAQRRWAASLSLGFRGDVDRTRLVTSRHHGPLRVQRPFYPEGRVCHVYLLHPPGGLVSGDELRIEAALDEHAHALITTPAATKLYRADGHDVAWDQHTRLQVADGGALEWLPQETLCFDGSRGRQTTEIVLHGGGRCLGWEVMVLGRPASQLPFESGHIEQRFRLTHDGRPLWIERQPLDPQHPRFRGRWGQGGATVQATLWAAGLDDPQASVVALREALGASRQWAATQRQGLLLLRYLGGSRNEAWSLCQHAWRVLRPLLLGREACVPRIWLT